MSYWRGKGFVKTARIRLQIVVALSGAVIMSLEILGSRVLAPSYGSSVYVWGSLLTVFLTALAAGYALGGRLADRHPETSAISLILAGAAVLILPSIQFAPGLLAALGRAGWDMRLGSLAAALLLFLPPSLLMGMVSPFAVRVAVPHLEKVGAIAGGYSALSTAGSIVGTLATAFLLIPMFPVPTLLLGLAGTLVLGAVLLMASRATVLAAGLAALACVVTGFSRRPAEADAGVKILVSRDTAYHHLQVFEFEQDAVRMMRFDNLTQGGMNLKRPERSVFGYDEAFFGAFALKPGIRRVCVIGLGAGTFPRRLAQLLPEAQIDTVEIDPVVAQIAKEYFAFPESERNRIFVEDGRVFLARGGAPYDLIVLDAYNATGVPFHLMTREFFALAKSRLSRNGVFAANFLGHVMGEKGELFWSALRTIRNQFGQVYVMAPDLAEGSSAFQRNAIVLATVSADPVSPEQFKSNAGQIVQKWRVAALLTYAAAVLRNPPPRIEAPELSDSFAPVEALQSF
jgi:spermidine synthase